MTFKAMIIVLKFKFNDEECERQELKFQ